MFFSSMTNFLNSDGRLEYLFSASRKANRKASSRVEYDVSPFATATKLLE